MPASGARLCHVVADRRGDQRVVADGTASLVSSDFDVLSADLTANGYGTPADDAAAARPYVAGAPTCVGRPR